MNLSRTSTWFPHAATLAVGLTGIVYGWMRYVSVPDDEFAVVNHPYQPTLQHLHILFAPVLVFALGVIWQSHAKPRLVAGTPRKRYSGLGLLLSSAPMVLSGYLLQTTSDELWQEVWVWVHVSSSCLWLLAYLRHLVAKRSSRPAS